MIKILTSKLNISNHESVVAKGEKKKKKKEEEKEKEEDQKTYVIYLQGNGTSNLYNIKNSISEEWKTLNDLNLEIRFISYPILAEFYHRELFEGGKNNNNSSAMYYYFLILPILAALIFLPTKYLFKVAIVIFIAFPLLILSYEPRVQFHLKIKESVTAVCALVIKLLKDERSIYPDQILLFGNSIGGGIAAQVYHEFQQKGIYLKCIVSNSFSSLKGVISNFTNNVFLRDVIKYLVSAFNMNLQSHRYINEITPYTAYFNRKNDNIIPHQVQLRTKILSSKPCEGSSTYQQAAFKKFHEQKTFLEGHTLLVCKVHDNSCPSIHNERMDLLVSDNTDKPVLFLDLIRYFIKESKRYTSRVESLNNGYDQSSIQNSDWAKEFEQNITFTNI